MKHRKYSASPGFSIATLLFASLFLLAQNTQAYKRTVSSAGEMIYWPSSCFHYSINESGYGPVDFSDLRDIFRASFDAWEDTQCSYFYFEETSPAAVSRVEFDQTRGNVNLLVFREGDYVWPEDQDVLALTSVTFEPSTGIIYDADIEFNATGSNQFGTLDDYTDASQLFDLQSTATHEIGHMLGLDHELGLPEATMYFDEEPGNTLKRTLDIDDINGVCAIYPLADDPEICNPPHCGLDLTGTSEVCENPSMNNSSSDPGCGCFLAGRKDSSGMGAVQLIATVIWAWNVPGE